MRGTAPAHTLRSDVGKVESQEARSGPLLFVFIMPWIVRHVKAVISDCISSWLCWALASERIAANSHVTRTPRIRLVPCTSLTAELFARLFGSTLRFQSICGTTVVPHKKTPKKVKGNVNLKRILQYTVLVRAAP